MSWTLDGHPLRRVLVTRLRYLGDVVMSTVVVEMLRRGDPDLVIDYLCEAGHAPVLAGHPDLERVHALGAQRRGGDAAARAATTTTNQILAGGTLATAWQLGRRRYDLAVDLFFNPRSAWLLTLAGIRRRIGGTTSRSRRHLYSHIVTSLPRSQRPRLYELAGGGLGEHLGRLAPLCHEGRHFLDWFEDVAADDRPAPRIQAPALVGASLNALKSLNAEPGDYTLLAPGATWPSKEWPLPHWNRLARELGDAGHTVVVLQPPGRPEFETGLAETFHGAGGVLPVLPLTEALAVVGGAARVVSVDGGVMHAAVGLRRPTVALFGPTDPGLWFPYTGLGPFRVLATRPECHPCHRHECDAFVCLPDLAPDQVLAALAGLSAC